MLLVLDTNVVSEVMKTAPDRRVADWLRRRPLEQLAITAVTVAEIRYGIDRLDAGRRQRRLAESFAALVSEAFAGQVLPFDAAAAAVYARIKAGRERSGRPISVQDAQIAAIARSHAASVVTRNVADFAGCELEVIDPWLAS